MVHVALWNAPRISCHGLLFRFLGREYVVGTWMCPKMLGLYYYNSIVHCTSWHPCSTSSSATTFHLLKHLHVYAHEKKWFAWIKFLCLLESLEIGIERKRFIFKRSIMTYGTKSQIFLYTMCGIEKWLLRFQ